MNWVENDELVSIFLAEVDARSQSLLEGARSLISGSLSDDHVPDLVRDAHTLKGSAAMMERPDVAKAAKAMESAWSLVEKGELRSPVLGTALLELSESLPAAARSKVMDPGLGESTDRLASLLQFGLVSAPPPPPADSAYGRPEAGPVAAPPEEDRRGKSEMTSNLGGLLPSLDGKLDGSVVRVDSGGLYGLINRIVELGIEVDALEDLTAVEFGPEQSRVLDAWRRQIARLASETRALQMDAVDLVNVPFAEALESFNQFVRFLSRRLQKTVRFEAVGVDIMVDRQIVDLLREPLRHVVVNAVDHGIELAPDRLAAGKPATGTVRLEASLDDDRLVILVVDDGRGIDWDAVRREADRQDLPTGTSELVSHLLRPGFSVTEAGSEFSGVGEGLSVVADAVDRVSGSVLISSTPGKGTTVRVEVPASLLLQRVITVNAGGQVVGLIEAAVVDSVELTDGAKTIGYGSESIPVFRLARIVGGDNGSESSALVVSTRSGLVAVAITELLGERRLAVKNVGPILGRADHLAGAAFLGGGEVLVVVDHHHIGKAAREAPVEDARERRVLVVDDSSGVRQLIAATLRGHGFEVDVASDATAARASLEGDAYDVLVVDYAMPGSSGTELVSELRTIGVAIPIVMVSGVASEEQKRVASSAGVDVYLDKYDFRQGALIDAISALLGTETGGD